MDPFLFPPLPPLAVKNDVGSEICFCCFFFLELRFRGKLAEGADDEDADGGVAEEPESAKYVQTPELKE